MLPLGPYVLASRSLAAAATVRAGRYPFLCSCTSRLERIDPAVRRCAARSRTLPRAARGVHALRRDWNPRLNAKVPPVRAVGKQSRRSPPPSQDQSPSEASAQHARLASLPTMPPRLEPRCGVLALTDLRLWQEIGLPGRRRSRRGRRRLDDPPLPRFAYVDHGGLDASAYFACFLRPDVERCASMLGDSHRCRTQPSFRRHGSSPPSTARFSAFPTSFPCTDRWNAELKIRATAPGQSASGDCSLRISPTQSDGCLPASAPRTK